MLRYAKYLMVIVPVLLLAITMVTAQEDPRCAGFRRLSGGDNVISTYAWSTVPEIDEYKVNFFGANGQFVTSYWVLPPKNSLDVNLGDLATGAFFQWEVEALENGGAKVCNTGRSGMARLPVDRKLSITPQPPAATPSPTPTVFVKK